MNEEMELEASEYNIWTCAKCSHEFVDPEDYPEAEISNDLQLEIRLYWLSPTEVLCSDCAIKAGIPPLDKE